MERTSMVFTAVESQLSEGDVFSQLLKDAVYNNDFVVLIAVNHAVRWLNWQIKLKGKQDV